MNTRRPALTLIEVLVVIAVIGLLVAMLLPAVQQVREAAARSQCKNNLKQIGLALHNCHDAYKYLPPGMLTETAVVYGQHTGFTYLLPYLEQADVHALYDYKIPWYEKGNYEAVGRELAIFYCPTNRRRGSIDLAPMMEQWSCDLPPTVASTDYILCKGANASLGYDPSLAPLQVRGLFNVATPAVDSSFRSLGKAPRFRVRLKDVTDGTSTTFAVGEGAGGNPYFQIADVNNPTLPVRVPFSNAFAVMEQAWAAASITDKTQPWYAGIFGVTAQYGMGIDPRNEPMNRRLGTPSIVQGDQSGSNYDGLDSVSGFRSMHSRGCHFLHADGSVHWIAENIHPATYRALSTYAGGEIISGYGVD